MAWVARSSPRRISSSWGSGRSDWASAVSIRDRSRRPASWRLPPSPAPRACCPPGRWPSAPCWKAAIEAGSWSIDAASWATGALRLSPIFSASTCSDRAAGARMRRQLGAEPLQVRSDHLVEPVGHRIACSHARQHVLHDPAVDPAQQVLGLAIDQGLHQHQRRRSETGPAACCQRRSAGPRSRRSGCSGTHPDP